MVDPWRQAARCKAGSASAFHHTRLDQATGRYGRTLAIVKRIMADASEQLQL